MHMPTTFCIQFLSFVEPLEFFHGHSQKTHAPLFKKKKKIFSGTQNIRGVERDRREMIYEPGSSTWLLMQETGSLGLSCSALSPPAPNRDLANGCSGCPLFTLTAALPQFSFIVSGREKAQAPMNPLPGHELPLQCFSQPKTSSDQCLSSSQSFQSGPHWSPPEGTCLASVYSKELINPFLLPRIRLKLFSILGGNN